MKMKKTMMNGDDDHHDSLTVMVAMGHDNDGNDDSDDIDESC